MRSRLMPIAWLAAMIFPVAWLVHEIGPLNYVFNLVFAGEWVHVLAHTALYFVLIVLWFRHDRELRPRRELGMAVGLALLVGAAQEAFQYATSISRAGTPGIIFDLMVDGTGGLLGYYFLIWIRRPGNPHARNRLARYFVQ